VRNELRQFELKERIDKKIVEEFIRQHPDLPGLARLVASTPTDPGVFRTSNGNYQWEFTNRLGATQVVQTMGRGTKLAALAGSIGSFVQVGTDGIQMGITYVVPAGQSLVITSVDINSYEVSGRVV
jgi:hypothetical protein